MSRFSDTDGRTKFGVALATVFGAGLVPFAPGSAGSLAALPLAFAVSHLGWPWQLAVAAAVTVGGIPAASVAGRYFQVVDAKQIVIDEVAGMLITLVGVPFTWQNVLAGFFFFRLFDITKPWPASYFDKKVKNGAGVVLDDVAAGLYARLVLAGLALLLPAVFARG